MACAIIPTARMKGSASDAHCSELPEGSKRTNSSKRQKHRRRGHANEEREIDNSVTRFCIFLDLLFTIRRSDAERPGGQGTGSKICGDR